MDGTFSTLGYYLAKIIRRTVWPQSRRWRWSRGGAPPPARRPLPQASRRSCGAEDKGEGTGNTATPGTGEIDNRHWRNDSDTATVNWIWLNLILTVLWRCSMKWLGMKKKFPGAGAWWGDHSMHPEAAWFYSEFLEKDLNEFHQIWQIWSKLAASIVWKIWTGDQWIFMDLGWGFKGLGREKGLGAKIKAERVVPL